MVTRTPPRLRHLVLAALLSPWTHETCQQPAITLRGVREPIANRGGVPGLPFFGGAQATADSPNRTKALRWLTLCGVL